MTATELIRNVLGMSGILFLLLFTIQTRNYLLKKLNKRSSHV